MFGDCSLLLMPMACVCEAALDGFQKCRLIDRLHGHLLKRFGWICSLGEPWAPPEAVETKVKGETAKILRDLFGSCEFSKAAPGRDGLMFRDLWHT